MKNCAVIAEYNPFHTGHKYQLDVINSQGFDNIVCVMSGSFVQSAMPAFCDKALRAECAVLGGASAVVELPVVYATASAQMFAEGGLKIIAGIKDITHIAMGATVSEDIILRMADIKLQHRDKFQSILKAELNNGKSYNAATALALNNVFAQLYPHISAEGFFNDPNNILCIEYITAINKYCANIQPLIIQRKGANYNDSAITGEYISATAIRNADLNDVKQFIPYNYDKIRLQRESHTADITLYKNLALFALKRAQPEEIKVLRDCSEGMEFLLKNVANLNNLDEIIDAAIGKRYSKKRIFRLLLCLLLGIDKSMFDKPFCTRLLACKRNFDFSVLPIFITKTNSEIKEAAQNSDIKSVLQADINATALYNTLSQTNGDYFNYSVVKA